MFTKKYNKVILAVSIVVCIVLTFFATNIVKAITRPVVTISNIPSCNEGDTISFTVDITGDHITTGGTLPFDESFVLLSGFSANVSVKRNSVSDNGGKFTVTLNNVRGNESGNYIRIKGGAAVAFEGRTTFASPLTSSNTFDIRASDTKAPTISIIGPNVSSINDGGTVTYIVRYADESGVTNVNLNSSSIALSGFTANITVSGSGENSKVVERKVILSNVQGSNGNKYISVHGGTASDYSLNRVGGANSSMFELVNKQTVDTSVNNKPSNNNTRGNENNTSISGNTKQQENTNSVSEDNNTEIDNKNDKPADWIENPKTGKY